jgi:hypothetical protein
VHFILVGVNILVRSTNTCFTQLGRQNTLLSNIRLDRRAYLVQNTPAYWGKM